MVIFATKKTNDIHGTQFGKIIWVFCKEANIQSETNMQLCIIPKQLIQVLLRKFISKYHHAKSV